MHGSDAADASDAQALDRAIATLRNFSGGKTSGAPSLPFTDPSGTAVLRFSEEVRTELDGGMELIIPSNTTFRMSAELDGDPQAPRLDELVVTASGQGVTVRRTEGFAPELTTVHVQRLTLRPGGEIEADYELFLEQAIDGGISAFRLFAAVVAMGSGDPGAAGLLSGPPPDTCLSGVRAEVDEIIRTEVQPQLIDRIRDNDDAIEGWSLCDVLDIPPAETTD